MTKKINTVGVIGAGTMGLGIAQVTALAGYNVQLYDSVDELAEATLPRIERNLQIGIEKGKVSKKQMEDTLARITTVNQLQDLESEIVLKQ